jgi:hypothetical protein
MKAERSWLVVGAVVSGIELAAPRGELLSHGVDRALESHPVLTRAAILYLGAHLLNLIPQEIDPLYQIAVRLGHEA